MKTEKKREMRGRKKLYYFHRVSDHNCFKNKSEKKKHDSPYLPVKNIEIPKQKCGREKINENNDFEKNKMK